jgi:serine phosphatase RsbU (regulator of sigma subunit)/CHASE1-domain containing sensor protein
MRKRSPHPLQITDSGCFGRLARAGLRIVSPARRRRQAHVARLWLPATVLLLALGPVVGYLAWRNAAEDHRVRAQGQFEDELSVRAEALSRQVLSFSEVLHACQGLFDASERVTRQEFSTFTRQARSRHPCILHVGWAPRVRSADVPAHVAAVRASGFTTYQVWSPESSAGGDGPAALRAPLLYVEPLEHAVHLMGRDLLAHPEIGPVLLRAAARHEARLTDPARLDPEDRVPLGVMVLPVYSRARDRTLGEPIGTVLLTFRYADLAEEARGRPAHAADMHLDLQDVRPGGARRMLASVGPRAADDPEGIRARKPLTVAGREWLLDAAPSSAFLQREHSGTPLLAGLVALAIWELLAGCMLALSHAWRSTALRRQGRAVSRVLQSLGEGVVVAGREGRVRLMNEAAHALLGEAADDLDAADFDQRVRFARSDGSGELPPGQTPLARAMRGEVLELQVYRLTTPNAPSGVWVSVSGRPLRDEWGALLGGVLVLRDVTAKRRADLALRESDRRLRERAMEMRLAAEVQQHLYPRAAPDCPALDLAGAVSSAEETCGDYYDYLELPDGSLCLAVGDVSGHGLGPALIMAGVRAYVRSLAWAGERPEAILRRVNEHLCADLADGHFVTLVLVRIEADRRTLSYASAGHTPALLLDAGGEVKARLARTGRPLGLFPDSTYEACNGHRLDDGDVLVLMTDGATEAVSPRGDMFEEDGVLATVRARCERPAAEILAHLHTSLGEFCEGEPVRDDVTLVVCKRPPVPDPVGAISAPATRTARSAPPAPAPETLWASAMRRGRLRRQDPSA